MMCQSCTISAEPQLLRGTKLRVYCAQCEHSHAVQAESVSFTITYKNGHVGGHVGHDTLTISDSPIVLTNQTLGLADSASLDFSNASCDGIFVSAFHTRRTQASGKPPDGHTPPDHCSEPPAVLDIRLGAGCWVLIRSNDARQDIGSCIREGILLHGIALLHMHLQQTSRPE